MAIAALRQMLAELPLIPESRWKVPPEVSQFLLAGDGPADAEMQRLNTALYIGPLERTGEEVLGIPIYRKKDPS